MKKNFVTILLGGLLVFTHMHRAFANDHLNPLVSTKQIVGAPKFETSGKELDPHIYSYLVQAGMPREKIVVNAGDLLNECALTRLLEAGWTLESGSIGDNSQITLVAGIDTANEDVGLYEPGQRIIFDAEGTITLSTFARSKSFGAMFLQTIIITSDGTILANRVTQLPRFPFSTSNL